MVGAAVPSTVDHASVDVRILPATTPALPTGVYRFEEPDGSALLLQDQGLAAGAPLEDDWSAPDDAPLINAYGWFLEWWDTALIVPRPRFASGADVVTVPEGQEARVRGRSFAGSTWMYRVRVDGRTVTVHEGGLALPEVDDDPFDWIQRPSGDVDRFAATLTRAKLARELTDTVFSFRATRTIFRPYQFRPVMRLLETGRLRLLIADEVGLGKTIEAGLVWTELDARRAADRVLVVCPSMLVPKWIAEMEERFGYTLAELDRDGLKDLLNRVETDRLPSRFHAICSVERLRTWNGLERLTELAPSFDLVVADEAHVFRNSGTKSHALGALLSDWADALVFLSATPLNLGNDDLYNLLELLAPGEFDDRLVLEERLEPNAVLNRVSASLLDPEVSNLTRLGWLGALSGMTFGSTVIARPEFDDLQALLQQPRLAHADIAAAKRLISRLHSLSAVVTRTRKVEIQEHKAVREAIRIDVEWTDDESRFYLAFEEWQRDRARQLGLPVGFVTQMPRRLASTCLPAARERVLNADLHDDDMDATGDDGSADVIAEMDALPPQDVVEAARALPDGVDTKFDAFLERLLPISRQGRQVLVFTFSRVALAYLQRRLREHVRLCVLHGGIDKAERHATMQRFRAGDFQVMVASRVASEGLDFEFCSAVVNYDLPWNPMEVEQRIGRIDRFGQTEDKVLVLNFHTPGTIESDIIERVHQRIGVFNDSIGELEPILQSALGDLRRAMFSFDLTEAERQRRLDEMLTALEEQRHTHAEVENATSYLASTDDASIDGFEQDVVSSGRYVGQPELALLLGDWAGNDPYASTDVSADGLRLTLRGTAKLASELMGVQAAGERSAAELDALARALRDEREIIVCLDQETARVTGAPLLTTNHPLVRAALRVPGDRQIRFADLTVRSGEMPVGSYLVLIAIARWAGIHAATEVWTSAVPLEDTGTAGVGQSAEIGSALLAALADAAFRPGPGGHAPGELRSALERASHELLQKQVRERNRREAANAVLVETRRISLEETHKRKLGQIRRRIATMRQRGRGPIHLQESQLATQERRLQAELSRLEAQRACALDVEPLAVACVTIRPY